MAEAPAGLVMVVAELALQEAAEVVLVFYAVFHGRQDLPYAVEATDRAGRRNFAAIIAIDS